MCGIFGVVIRDGARMEASALHSTVRDLFKFSESRGKEAAGIAVATSEHIRVLKDAVAASSLIARSDYRELLQKSVGPANGRISYAAPAAIIGHSRLVTNGVESINENNQPVLADDLVAVHNGIICNHAEIRARHAGLPVVGELDTEVLVRLIERDLERGVELPAALRAAMSQVQGTATLAILSRSHDALVLATNNGSLYTCIDPEHRAVLFASEQSILDRVRKRAHIPSWLANCTVKHQPAGEALAISLAELNVQRFSLRDIDEEPAATERRDPPRALEDQSRRVAHVPSSNGNGRPVEGQVSEALRKWVEEGIRQIPELRRCTRCILPETMPFITFDADGVCNYCQHYEPVVPAGPEALERAVESMRRPGTEPDCLLALSGGRDSTYALHYVCRELGLKPITYTYDWGMVTDLARRNQARICGKLGVEHIFVSADIRRKRDYIRRNVSAWLRRPDLGTVPLFMAGDKQFFYHANRLQKETGMPRVIFSMNPLEKTDFKTGFCGIERSGIRGRFYGLSALGKLRIAIYYAKQYALNPAYLNVSLWDTLGAFCSYYLLPQDYLQFYHYIRWDEQTIERTLIDEYDWEVAPDTKSTWRIGDGTASFYNYIYYVGAGFCENDTFRSNQIREGVLDRATALERIAQENQPRLDSLQWYCRTIKIDPEQAIRTINAMPKRYAPRVLDRDAARQS